MTVPPHLRHVDISPEQWLRWRDRARALGEIGHPVRLELAATESDCTLHNVGRALNAARYVASTATGDAKQITSALAAELEAVTRTVSTPTGGSPYARN